MNLRENQITVGELLENPAARAAVQRLYPGLLKNPMVARMRHLTLAQVLRLAAPHIPQNQLETLLEALRRCQ